MKICKHCANIATVNKLNSGVFTVTSNFFIFEVRHFSGQKDNSTNLRSRYHLSFLYFICVKLDFLDCIYRAVARFLLVGGQAGPMLNLSIQVYSKILTRKIFYCKFFNFWKNFPIFNKYYHNFERFCMIEKLLFY